MPSRVALIVLAVLGVPRAVAAQAPTPPSTGTAVIRGRVVAGDTGKPLRRARVGIVRPGQGGPRNVVTDGDGRYEAKDLPPGQYVVTASRSGYLPLRYGQHRAREAAKPLDVADARTIEHVDFALPRTAVIEGRVADETGDPMGGVTIFAVRAEYFRGRRQLVPGTTPTSTDDAGHYRVTGLSPGTYMLRAMSRETWTVTRDGRKELMGFAPTYFPGTADVKDAQAITIGMAGQAVAIDFAMVPVRTVKVSGTALNAHGRAASYVGLVREVGGPNGGAVGMAGTASPAPDGSFVIRNVIPGEYKLKAVGMDEVATLPILVGNADVEHVSIVTSAGWSVTGTITAENSMPPDLPPGRVRLTINPTTAVSAMRMEGEPMPRQMLNNDWTFSATAIVGAARFGATLPDGWIVKSILHDGRDITNTAIERKSGEALSGVQIVLTNRVASVTASITDGQGAPVTDGSMILFASDSTKWSDGSPFVRAVRANQDGQFQVTALPAGEYLVIALDYVEDGMWNDPDYLQSLRSSAQTVTVAGAQSLSMSIKLASP